MISFSQWSDKNNAAGVRASGKALILSVEPSSSFLCSFQWQTSPRDLAKKPGGIFTHAVPNIEPSKNKEELPWLLCVGDVRANLEHLQEMETARPEATATEIWHLLKKGLGMSQVEVIAAFGHEPFRPEAACLRCYT